jgi:hypothetical protein
MAKIILEHLAANFSQIPPESGTNLAHAAAVCLENRGHSAGVTLAVHGDESASFTVEWSFPVTSVLNSYWSDLVEATEYGAYGVGLLLMNSLTGLRVIKRSGQGTGFDWWIGDEDNVLQNMTRLEVSGILMGTGRQIRDRASSKIRQVRKAATAVPHAYIVVVEFGTPRAEVVRI